MPPAPPPQRRPPPASPSSRAFSAFLPTGGRATLRPMGERILHGLAPLALAFTATLAACGDGTREAGNVTEARLLAAEDNGDDWLSHGRTYAEQRFSPLTDVNDRNVGQL